MDDAHWESAYLLLSPDMGESEEVLWFEPGDTTGRKVRVIVTDNGTQMRDDARSMSLDEQITIYVGRDLSDRLAGGVANCVEGQRMRRENGEWYASLGDVADKRDAFMLLPMVHADIREIGGGK